MSKNKITKNLLKSIALYNFFCSMSYTICLSNLKSYFDKFSGYLKFNF